MNAPLGPLAARAKLILNQGHNSPNLETRSIESKGCVALTFHKAATVPSLLAVQLLLLMFGMSSTEAVTPKKNLL